MPLPATGTWNAPGKDGAQADTVLTARQDGVPLLFFEVDNCHETPEELADKLERYARFLRRKMKDTDGKERPMWRTRWRAPESRHGDAPHPPVLLVFNHLGKRDPNRKVPRLQELTRHLWQGQRVGGGHHLYDGKIPVVAVGLRNLREHGPAGAVFFRFGREHPQPLLEAIGNPRREAADAREQDRARAQQAAHKAQVQRAAQEQGAKKAAEREARRPVCAGCGAKFTDERWAAAQSTDWDTPKDTHPNLCDACKQKVGTVVSPAADTRERQEPVRGEVGQHDFKRNARRPVCPECGAAFTDERWKATERVGWGVTPEPNPSLCGDCDRRYVTDVREVWADERPQQEQGQALPIQKATRWFSRRT
ncbi:replication-relaxation family protein [Streptomyces sp. A5-4]|uniref:replication-relaxation family protein n=1 Tax=Streptomyces sp. A5-4 TaxID=3384771 RepID=UPI003DA98358